MVGASLMSWTGGCWEATYQGAAGSPSPMYAPTMGFCPMQSAPCSACRGVQLLLYGPGCWLRSVICDWLMAQCGRGCQHCCVSMDGGVSGAGSTVRRRLRW